jgi:CDP-glycerol glycerophosphotransferase (TagB/SpsB family)
MRIGFIYFHHIHHVYHSVPIAFELSSRGFKVDLIVTSESVKKVIDELTELYPRQKCKIVILKGTVSYRYNYIRRKKYPRPKIMMEKYAHKLNQYDILVGTSFETHRLFDQFGVNNPKYVFTFHGIGVRDYGFQSSLKRYDLLLLPGKSIVEYLVKSELVNEGNWEVIGYPKFDFIERNKKTFNSIFPEKRPIIIYNPHWNKKVSSWYDWGKKVLEFFLSSTDYNLIFAPHILIKEWKQRWLKLAKYQTAPHIHIDLGSHRLIDMTYTRIADAYLGDVSSQVFEYINEPKPCLFLNCQDLKREKERDFPQWKFGNIVSDFNDLPGKLDAIFDDHPNFIDNQKTFIQSTFDSNDLSSGQRGADAIIKRFSL